MRRVSLKRKSKGKDKKEKTNEENDVREDTSNESEQSEDENEENGEPQSKRKKKNEKKSSKEKKHKNKEKSRRNRNGEESKKENGEGGSSDEEGEDEGGDENEDYEVEEIMDERIHQGVRQYYIRWKGYTSSSDSWEPEKTLNCPELISKFHETHEKIDLKKYKNKKAKKETKKSASSKDETWDENEEFEVERIIEVHHRRDGKRDFLVHWKGYSTAQDSWEPEDNLNCRDLIDKFMKRVDALKDVDQRNLREKRKHTERLTYSTTDSGRRLSKRHQGKQRVQYHDAE